MECSGQIGEDLTNEKISGSTIGLGSATQDPSSQKAYIKVNVKLLS